MSTQQKILENCLKLTFNKGKLRLDKILLKNFFDALPQELQIAAKYVADGGTDMKGLFRTLAHVEETIQLDPSNEQHQAEIARQYLTATNFGSPEEIQEEIDYLERY